MLKRYERICRKDSFKGESREDFENWKEASRKLLKRLIRLDVLEADEIFSSECEGYTEEREELKDGAVREKVIVKASEDVFIPTCILIPKGKPKGVFLCLAGHQGAGKYSVAGRYDIPAVKERIERYNYDYGYKLMKKGYVAVCPDPRGFGERRDAYLTGDDKESFLTGSCKNLSNMALPLGLTVIGLLTFDNMRLIDYLQNRKEFDLTDLSCIGFSGGGMQTLYLAVSDERIKRAVISGYMYGFRDSLLELNGNCSCNYVPGIFEHFDMGDIMSLFAPRPLIIQSCRDDHLNGKRGMINVYEQMEIIQKAYALLGGSGDLRHDIREGGHRFHDEILEDLF
ncbi:MAG: alpha/beta hydrolase family protein [Lachnospiraceae bacterium]|nr:alpha/beta hydrolase family protein [Lachnospiraceae bacterium]